MEDKKSKFSILSAKGSRSAVETTAQIIFTICSVVAVAAVFSITLYMIISGTPAIFKVGFLDILFGSVWAPTAATPSYGILYIILTSIVRIFVISSPSNLRLNSFPISRNRDTSI